MNSNILLNDYGFNLEETFDKQAIERFKRSYEIVLHRRKLRWSSLNQSISLPVDSTVKRFVRKGIPGEYRSEAWFVYSGAQEISKQFVGFYEKWTKEPISESNESIINADIPRTFPEIEIFRNRNHPDCMLPHLQRVLTAFVNKNPAIGYCQGMNFIAGLILLVMMPEEEKAFWIFDTLVTRILQSYYISGMFRIQVDCMVLQELLKNKIPKVYDSITNKCGGSCILLSAKWFICAFVDVLPIQTALRVLDCVMCEGDKILFRAALAIYRLNQDAISRCESISELMLVFKDILKSESVLRCHEFSECMFSMIGSMSQKTINNSRKLYEQKLISNNEK